VIQVLRSNYLHSAFLYALLIIVKVLRFGLAAYKIFFFRAQAHNIEEGLPVFGDSSHSTFGPGHKNLLRLIRQLNSGSSLKLYHFINYSQSRLRLTRYQVSTNSHHVYLVLVLFELLNSAFVDVVRSHHLDIVPEVVLK